MSEISKLTVPILVNGEYVNTTFDIKDDTARQMIADLGNAMYWIGVTTTVLTDGSTTNPITVDGESKTANVGGVAQYDGEEFAWNGSAWQSLGKNNFGALAFKNSAEGSYTPAGSVNVTKGADTTTSVNSITGVGTLPSWNYSSQNEALTFSAGTLPTQGVAQTVITDVGALSGSFSGTAATITVS